MIGFDRSSVTGERGMPMISRALSMQSRLSNLLAMSLMLVIGVAFLAWYYLHIGARSARARPSSAPNSAAHSDTDMPLPSLGQLQPPLLAGTGSASPPAVSDAQSPVAVTAVVPYLASGALSNSASGQPPRPTALERRLSGATFAVAGAPSGAVANAEPAVADGSVGTPSALATLLRAEAPRMASARVLPTQRLLLPKGAFIDCTLETAIDSTLPGLTTCVTATDTFSADGTVVLLERGTKLLGETRGQVQQASSRVFVLWTEARTPAGVIVPLDSPGADELGRAGLSGQVERHFLERFGAAILISMIDGGVQAAVQATSKGSGTVLYNPSGAQDVLGEVLKDTLNIPPTIVKRNGDRIQVLVARDVDFSRVYELRDAIARP